MGCSNRKVANGTVNSIEESRTPLSDPSADQPLVQAPIDRVADGVSISSMSVIDFPMTKNNETLSPIDSDAFHNSFLQERQSAIDNTSYRKTIDSWSPSSLPELVKLLQNFTSNKSEVHQHWIVFYWIAKNIRYDTDSYFSKNIPIQPFNSVFERKVAVCEGYSNLYKYLCEQLGLTCEKVSGYAKGFGYAKRPAGKKLEVDHAWNAVEINNHWYLLDSTWGAGNVSEQQKFNQELNCFYFLTKPEQMIYNHLPVDEKWQLLRETIDQDQYIQLPRTFPDFFKNNLRIITPINQAHLDLFPKKNYALVIIKAPDDVVLIGSILNKEKKKVEDGSEVVYDRRRQVWICKFAPDREGCFEVMIYAKHQSSDESYPNVLMFEMNVKNAPVPRRSFPATWSVFYDFDLQLESPKRCSTITLSDGSSYAEVLIRAPDGIILSGSIKSNGTSVENGSLALNDPEKKLWRLLFAPESPGLYELWIFAAKEPEDKSTSVMKLHLNAEKLKIPQKFPTMYSTFNQRKCRLEEPLDGVLKKNSIVHMRCHIPDAISVQLIVDGRWISIEGTWLDQDVQVGVKEVILCAKFDDKSSYQYLLKYTVK